MPRGNGPRHNHAFVASRDPDTIRRAAKVSAKRTGPTSIRIVLTPGDVGHAFPTGDLFRRLTVSAEAVGDDFAVVSRAERHLARHYEAIRMGVGAVRVQKSDDRVGPEPEERIVDLDLGADGEGMPVYWHVRYERVEHPVSRDGEQALVEGGITVAQGRLP
jgi:hypothetical protein